MNTAQIPNTAYISTAPVDKIVRVFTGSYNGATQTTLHNDVWCYVIPHGLTRPVACEILTSHNGGATWLDDEMVFSDSTNIYIWHTPQYGVPTSPTPGTVHYKVYCNWIDNYDATNPLITTQQYGDVKTQFDSRLNFQKIHKQGVATGSTTIAHTLGYIPNAKAWFESFPNEVWKLHAGGSSNPYLYDFGVQKECYIEITALGLTIDAPSGGRVWYRIYYDAD